MRIQVKIICTEVYHSEKSNRNYITGVDLTDGSTVKFSTESGNFEVGKTYEVNSTFKCRPDKAGGVYLLTGGGE